VRIEVPNGVGCAPLHGGKYGKGLCPFAHPHPIKFVGNFMMVSE